MRSIALFRPLVAAFLVALPCLLGAGAAQALEKRLALVIGNAAYPAQPIATAANDAGLVAQTLQAAGFDVMGARDLDETGLRQAFRDFVEKAEAAGPEAVTFVYLSGYGLQVEGESYFAPVDARINAASDVALTALRVSDYAKRLAALPLKARFLVLDAGRRNPFARQGEPLAGGLALMEPEAGGLVAFNAAPGTVGPDETGSYGAYAKALAEMIRAGGLAPAELFDRVRLRVVESTKGALVPWDSARITVPFEFLARAPDAPPLERPQAALQARPLAEIGAQDAFALCLERDTVQGYQDFLGAYPNDPQAARVRAILAARREALTWRQSRLADSPDAYWSYLRRYPRGPHAFDARRRLASLSAALAPPPRFTEIVYDLPPPPADEIVYVERPVVYLADPVYALPPPPPVVFLAPAPAYFVDLAPPPPPVAAYLLPAPAYVPVPTYVAAPVGIAAPPDNPVFGNLHRALAPPAQGLPAGAAVGAAVGAAADVAAARVALPPALARRAGFAPGAAAPVPNGGAVPAGVAPLARPLPGAPVPQPGVRPGAPLNAGPFPRNALPQQPGGPAAGAAAARTAPPAQPTLRTPQPGQPVQDPTAARAARAAAFQQREAASRQQQAARQAQAQAQSQARAQARAQVQAQSRAQAQQAQAQARQTGRMQAMQQMQAARAQQVQAMRAQQMQQAAQRQQMMQMQHQQAAQRQQAMQRAPAPQRQAPPQGGGGHGHCQPGKPCR